MSVRVQVSSMKTSRSASTRPWYFVHWARRRATSGRSRSPAATLFFEAELLGMHEIPHRMVVDLQAASAKLGNEPAYGEIAVSDPLRQPGRVISRNCLWLVAAHLARLNAAGLLDPLHPANRRADRHSKLLGRWIAGHPALDRGYHTLAKVQRIRLPHPCWPPTPASMVNQKQADLGIPNRFNLTPSRFSSLSVIARSACDEAIHLTARIAS